MAVEFKDNSIAVKAALGDAAEAFLREAAGELVSQTARNTRVDTGQLKSSWQYTIRGSVAMIGSPLENAIWEEFGTGEYALEGDGRKGGWIYRNKEGKTVFTLGKRPNRTLYRAFTGKKNQLIRRAEDIVKGRMK